MHPEAAKLKRGSSKLEDQFPMVSERDPSHARLIVRYVPDLAELHRWLRTGAGPRRLLGYLRRARRAS
jgi:hypothetical protein